MYWVTVTVKLERTNLFSGQLVNYHSYCTEITYFHYSSSGIFCFCHGCFKLTRFSFFTLGSGCDSEVLQHANMAPHRILWKTSLIPLAGPGLPASPAGRPITGGHSSSSRPPGPNLNFLGPGRLRRPSWTRMTRMEP